MTGEMSVSHKNPNSSFCHVQDWSQLGLMFSGTEAPLQDSSHGVLLADVIKPRAIGLGVLGL